MAKHIVSLDKIPNTQIKTKNESNFVYLKITYIKYLAVDPVFDSLSGFCHFHNEYM